MKKYMPTNWEPVRNGQIPRTRKKLPKLNQKETKKPELMSYKKQN